MYYEHRILRMDGLPTEIQRAFGVSQWKTSFTGIALLDEDLIIYAVNDLFCSMTGITPADIIGVRLVDLIPAKERERELRNLELLKRPEDYYDITKKLEFPTGYVSVTVTRTAALFARDKKILSYAMRILEVSSQSESHVEIRKRVWLSDKAKENLILILTTIGAGMAAYMSGIWTK